MLMISPNPLGKLAGFCGPMHLWILFANLIMVGVSAGILWGSLSAKVDNLRTDIVRERDQQLQWNSEERRQDDLHRERMNQIQLQLFDLLKEIKSR